jgi:hypothetical protein
MSGSRCLRVTSENQKWPKLYGAKLCFNTVHTRDPGVTGDTRDIIMDKLNHVLSHMMATNELILENISTINSILQQRTIEQCQNDEGAGGPVMHR